MSETGELSPLLKFVALKSLDVDTRRFHSMREFIIALIENQVGNSSSSAVKWKYICIET